MNYHIARLLLESCDRDELIDRTFGDMETTWYDEDGKVVAVGYFGRTADVTLFGEPCSLIQAAYYEGPQHDYTGEEARLLARRGNRRVVSYNDTLAA
jgi:hypothetical protein